MNHHIDCTFTDHIGAIIVGTLLIGLFLAFWITLLVMNEQQKYERNGMRKKHESKSKETSL